MSAAPAILAATDFSAHARHAADRAARIAAESSATLTLLHVVPGSGLEQLRGWLGVGTSLEGQLLDDARRQLRELGLRLQTPGAMPIDTVVKEGAVLDTALQEADRLDARLIALGTRGAGFMRRLVLGTTAERLMRRSTRPVLAVRQTPHEHYRRALVAIDFSPWSDGALALARWAAPRADLVLASVFQVPYEDKLRLAGVEESRVALYREQARAETTRRLHALAERTGLRPAQWQACVVEGDPSFRLVEKEQEFDCDLIAVGKHGTSMAVDLLLGSVTHHVLAEGSADVLISSARSDR